MNRAKTTTTMAAAIRADQRSPIAVAKQRFNLIRSAAFKAITGYVPWRIRSRLERILPATKGVIVFGDSLSSVGSRRSLVVTSDLSGSGAPRLVRDLALWLRARGDEVIVLSPEDGVFRKDLTEAGIAVVIGPAISDRRAHVFRRLANMADVGLCNTIVAAPAVAALASRIPLIWFIHEISMLEDWLERDSRFASTLAKPARLWAGSELPAKILRRHRPDVDVVPYGLTPIGDAPPPGSRSGRRLRIGIFGTYELRKGQDLALAALALLSPTDRAEVEIIMHGRVLSPEFFESLQHAASGFDNVTLGPALDHPAVDDAMLDCDAVLMPSRDDTLPMVTADALGCGRVLLCTRTTGTSAYLTPGVDGFVAEEPTAEAIAGTIAEALRRRSDWPAIGEAGRALFERVFSVATYRDRLDETFGLLEALRADRRRVPTASR